jgi:hypothetical protein
MQHPINASPPPAERTESLAPPCPAAEVPSELLWRQAIQATRDAASAAAELRQALGGPRSGMG